jgi:hypothetical protein
VGRARERHPGDGRGCDRFARAPPDRAQRALPLAYGASLLAYGALLLACVC